MVNVTDEASWEPCRELLLRNEGGEASLYLKFFVDPELAEDGSKREESAVGNGLAVKKARKGKGHCVVQ